MHFYNRILIFFMLAFLPLSVFANSGLPMIALGVPFMAILGLPVVSIEYYIYKKNFNILSKSILIHTFIANVITTIIGYPLSWGILLGVQAITGSGGEIPLDSITNIAKAVFFQAAWLIPHKDEMDWLIPSCGLVGMIPAFVTSYFFEKIYLRRAFNNPINISKIVFKAHIYSYALIMSVLVVKLIYALI